MKDQEKQEPPYLYPGRHTLLIARTPEYIMATQWDIAVDEKG